MAVGRFRAVCVWLLATTTIRLLPLLVIFKAAVMGIIYWMMREYAGRTLCYYTNRGLSPRELWGWSVALDSAIFIVCVAITVIIKQIWT